MVRCSCLLALLLVPLVAACGRASEGALPGAVTDTPDAPFAQGVRLSPAGQLIHDATIEGLVGRDAQGQVTPALADRWIVTDDGKSYIFRLRDGQWRAGGGLTGGSARDGLRQVLRRLGGASLGL